jgi:murein DD-endopeptidase MepM/ murein hydrolase activator NlpD
MKNPACDYRQILCRSASVVILIFFTADYAFGQNTRLSAGYSLRNFTVQTVQNPDFVGDIGFTQKGLLHVEMEQVFRHSYFLGVKGDYLIQNQNSGFTGGPVNFNQLSLQTNVGLQWDRIGIYAGVNAGYIWDLTFNPMGDSADGNNRVKPSGQPNSLFGGLQIGARYYLFKYLRLEAEFRNSGFLKNRFTPVSNQASESVLESVHLNPTQFSIGLSLSIPIRTGNRNRSATGIGSSPSMISTTGEVRFRSPVDGPAHITSSFGRRWGRMHEGIDIDAQKGDRIRAAADGIVIEAKNSLSYGRMVVIRHGTSYNTYYTHLSRIDVRTGDRIRVGDVVGLAGDSGVATGVHLHFELRRDGIPVDPERYIRF